VGQCGSARFPRWAAAIASPAEWGNNGVVSFVASGHTLPPPFARWSSMIPLRVSTPSAAGQLEQPTQRPPEPLIELHEVTKDYRSFRALDNISLALGGGVTGLLGPNGAGKSTLIKVLLGLVAMTRGTGHVLGYRLDKQQREIRSRVGYMTEDDCYVSGLSGIEMVRYVARLSGLPSIDALRRAHEILDYCGLEQERYRPMETYSTGMRQKVKFAQAIVHDPPLLILDEPTSGLDPSERETMLTRIRSLASDWGKAILVSTHILPDVQRTCDTVIILARGRVKMVDSLEVLRRPVEPAYQIRILGDVAPFRAEAEREGIVIVEQNDGLLTLRGVTESSSGRIWVWAERAGVGVRSLRAARNSLEQVFVDAVREGADAHL
jgi:ABC-2 type transport system ATP-binding protein